jgi:hypothetical protein
VVKRSIASTFWFVDAWMAIQCWLPQHAIHRGGEKETTADDNNYDETDDMGNKYNHDNTNLPFAIIIIVCYWPIVFEYISI